MRMFGKGRADRRTCHRTYLFDSPLRGRRYEAGLYSPDRCDGRQIEYALHRQYLEIAKRNGDEIGAYEGGTPPGLYFGDQIALADNFTSMHITSDADWDEEHPAGKPLDDLFRVSVRSWKQRDEYGAPLLCRERMDRIGPEHLQMIPFNPKNPWDGRKNLRPIEIEPLAEPASEQHHRLTLTMTTTDGRTKSTSIDYPPKTGL